MPVHLRTLGLLLACFGLGVGAGLLLFDACGQAAPVTLRFADTPAAGDAIRVYVSGAVRAPGVYSLRAGDRVVEAVEAAGGPADDADTDAVNFAQRIADEQHLHIPRIGEPGPASQTPQSAVATAGPEPVDINRADLNLLRTLPGVGATRAANIVTSRERDGPFQRPEDLVQRRLLTQTLYDRIKDLITVRP